MIQTILSAIGGGRATCANCDDPIGTESWRTEQDDRHCSVWCALRSQQGEQQ